MSGDALEPPICDDSGYHVRARDLSFLDITDEHVSRWRARSAPLGTSDIQFRMLIEQLTIALERDEIDPASCDLRLKGSSATFFSGLHKQLPFTRDEIIDVYREMHSSFPLQAEVAEIEDRLNRRWIADGVYPRRRPFDSLFRLGIAGEPSDIDLQLSCDEIVSRCERLLTSVGQSPTDARLRHPIYNLVRKDLVARACENLDVCLLRMADALKRHVSVAVFPSSGPPDTSAKFGELSAHMRPDDWVVICGSENGAR